MNIVLRFFFCELPLSIHSCAKVAWSLGAASLSMTGWDLGWLPTRSGGLRTSLGRQNWHCSPNQKQTSHTIIFRKAPFRSHQWLRGHFFVQSITLPGWFIVVWLRDLRCIGFSRKINDPLRNRCRRGESGFAHYWLTCHHVINSFWKNSVLFYFQSLLPPMLQWQPTLEIC